MKTGLIGGRRQLIMKDIKKSLPSKCTNSMAEKYKHPLK